MIDWDKQSLLCFSSFLAHGRFIWESQSSNSKRMTTSSTMGNFCIGIINIYVNWIFVDNIFVYNMLLLLYMLMYKQWLRGQDSVIKAQHQCSNWHVGTSKVQTRVASSWMYFFTITWNFLNYYPNIWEWSSRVLGNNRGNGSSSVFSISTIASL